MPVARDHLYKTWRWQRIRAHQLRIEPLCRFCLARGIVAPATIADHVVPHKGDVNMFWLGEFQSLCEPCHRSTKQQIEQPGYCRDVGLDGLPIDPNHPFNRAG